MTHSSIEFHRVPWDSGIDGRGEFQSSTPFKGGTLELTGQPRAWNRA